MARRPLLAAHWSGYEDKRLKELLERRLSVQGIAAIMGIPAMTIRAKMTGLGLSPNYPHNPKKPKA
jgi:hypothetical protein